MTLVLLPTPGRGYRTPSGFMVKVVEVAARKGVPTVVFELTRVGLPRGFHLLRKARCLFSCPASEWPTMLLDGVPHELRSNG